MTQLEVELQLCRENFKFFLGYCYAMIYKRQFIFYDFHNRLIDCLLNCHTEKRLIINAPPRIGKTEIIKHFIAWQFLQDPSSTIIYISYDEKLVARKNREIQDILKLMVKRFNLVDLKFKANADGKTEWTNNAQGSIIARGSGGALTGSGARTLMVIDDPNKPADRISSIILEHRNKNFVSTIRNRIDTPDVPIIIVQQRIANNDLSGFLLSGNTNEKWIHYNFPAINEDGTALCPERLPIDEIENYKKQPFEYHAQYMQTPLDDIGKLFMRDRMVLGTVRPPLEKMKLVCSVDAAIKCDVKSDFNAIAIIGYDGVNFHIVEIQNFNADITVLCDKLRDVRKRYPMIPLIVESKANGSPAVQILRKEMSGVLEIDPVRSKIDRAIAVKYLFDACNVHFHIRDLIWGTVVQQFTAFPHGKNDDIVDAVAQGITWLQSAQLSVAPPANNIQIRRDLTRPQYRGNWR